MKIVEVLIRINNILYKFEKFVLSLCVLGIFIVLILNVFTRFILRDGIAWAEEVGNLFVTWICFVGVSYAARSGRHIIMSAVYDFMPVKIQKIMIYLVDAGSIIGSIFLCNLGIQYVRTVYMMGRLSPTLLFPLWIPYLIIPIGFFMGALQYCILLAMNIKEPAHPVQYIYIKNQNQI